MKFSHLPLLAFTLLLGACTQSPTTPPDRAAIESTGMLASQTQDQKAVALLKQWAQAGNITAQRELAIALNAEGKGAEALPWLVRAADEGDHQAQFLLAETYYKGSNGVSKNDTQAWRWYLAAADQNPKASFMLARMAKYGEGKEKDLALSVHWLKKSSEQGNAQAMFLLSNAYEAGEGVTADKTLAQKWLEAAAEGDYPPAIQTLALQLDGRDSRTGHDPQRARLLIKEATDERLLRWNQYQ